MPIFLLIDEQRGRKVAKDLGLRTTGVIGVFLLAKKKGLLLKIAPLLIELEGKAGFWMSGPLREQALKLAGEL